MKDCKDCCKSYETSEGLFCSMAKKPCKVERRHGKFLSWLFITCGKEGVCFEKDFLEPSNDKSKITFEAIEKTAMSFSKHGVEVGRLTADGDFYFGNIAELKKKAYLVQPYKIEKARIDEPGLIMTLTKNSYVSSEELKRMGLL